jgi:primosomal protein N' (replication factor Y)
MTQSTERYALFAVANATAHELTYMVPPEIVPQVQRGTLCALPVLGRKLVGVFLDWCDKPLFECRPVESVIDDCPPLKPKLLDLLSWVAAYYCAPLGRTIHLAGPGFLWSLEAHAKRRKRAEKRARRNRPDPEHQARPLKVLTPEQQSAVAAVESSEAGQTTLLQGVTGSGKTEVYLHLVAQALSSGKRALVLVPEIALTPQMCDRFRVHFPEQLAVLHSGLTAVEYEREWFRVAGGEAGVVLGVRSAVFAPLENIGLIIVDEEHEQSYKCDEFPCYQARDVAVKRARTENARCLLGSATPSLETFLNAERSRYARVHLQTRHSRLSNRTELFQFRPKIHSTGGLGRGVVKSSQFSFTGPVMAQGVVELIADTHARGEQSMVILNRRGFAQFVLCGDCGEALKCPNCSVSTTLHSRGSRELCHYCGFSRPTLTECTACRSSKLVHMGLGTQNLEQELSERIQGLVVDRLDRDVLTSHSRLSEILAKFRSGETHCLVGTQMLSKGHDFPKVTLVVVLNVEDGLFVPDYRSAERTFQLLCQAAGRTGRGQIAGVVAVQSLGANHPVIHLALEGAVDRFLADELQMRQLGWHPPVCRQILIEMQHANENLLMQQATGVQKELAEIWQAQKFTPADVRLTGPMPAVLSKLRGVHRVQLVISARREIHPARLVPPELSTRKELQHIMRVDVDPFSFL